jgi:hypothetical protein
MATGGTAWRCGAPGEGCAGGEVAWCSARSRARSMAAFSRGCAARARGVSTSP